MPPRKNTKRKLDCSYPRLTPDMLAEGMMLAEEMSSLIVNKFGHYCELKQALHLVPRHCG